MFNNTVNTRREAGRLFLHCFPSTSLCSVTYNGHTLFPCAISCNYDDDNDYSSSSSFLAHPPSLSFSTSSFLPSFLSFSLSAFLQWWLCPSAAPFAIYPPVYHPLFPPIFLPGSYRTDLRHCNRLGEMHFFNYGETLAVKCRNFHRDKSSDENSVLCF